MSDGVAFASTAELGTLLDRGEVSPTDLVETYLGRIARLDRVLHAHTVVLAERARAAAGAATKRIAQSGRRHRLDGIPFGVKDQLHTHDAPTTCASHVPLPPHAGDSVVVARLRSTGAILIGKHNLNEFAMAEPSIWRFGKPRNPWDLERTAGGSSNGSAVAVAAGLCGFAIAQDTSGSIRAPAAWTGTVGLRPTVGTVDTEGLVGVSAVKDTIGPITRTVEDAAIVLSAIGNHPFDVHMVLRGRVNGLRIGVIAERWTRSVDPIDDDVTAAVEAALGELRRLGCAIREVTVPHIEHASLASQVTTMAERDPSFRPLLREHTSEFDPKIAAGLIAGALLPPELVTKARRIAAVIRRSILEALRDADVLVLPTAPGPPPLADRSLALEELAERIRGGTNAFVTPFAFAGVPAISVPCGFTRGRLPVGLQIVGRPNEDAVVLRIGHAYQRATSWHTMHPEVAA